MVRFLVIFVAIGLAASARAVAAPGGEDIDWVVIGDPNNVAYHNQWGGVVDGRGSVPYEYRIGRYEVTTAQWMEFVNTFSTQSDDMRHFGIPFSWGAIADGEYNGPGTRWKINPWMPDAASHPVHGIDWRIAARFCNWLHNGKSSDLSTIEDGAYDAGTFSLNGDGTFNDQATRTRAPGSGSPLLTNGRKRLITTRTTTVLDGAGGGSIPAVPMTPLCRATRAKATRARRSISKGSISPWERTATSPRRGVCLISRAEPWSGPRR